MGGSVHPISVLELPKNEVDCHVHVSAIAQTPCSSTTAAAATTATILVATNSIFMIRAIFQRFFKHRMADAPLVQRCGLVCSVVACRDYESSGWRRRLA